jgi:hypothetical protein
MAFWNGWMFLADHGSKDWPTTIGTISDARTAFNYFDVVSHGAPYEVVVRYIYDVDGTKYSGETEYHGYKTAKAADDVKTNYPFGGSMVIHHNPWFHAVSTLSPGSGEWSYIIGVAGFGILCLSIVMSGVFVNDAGTSPMPD